MYGRKARILAALAMLLLAVPVVPAGQAAAQAQSRTFPETGKTVKARFLQYWETHGGLAQQGYPISEEMQEVSPTDGKTYTVQYFERAVFELHPENVAPNDVLLSLLGNFLYKQKYPNGATGQLANSEPDSRLFPETGKHVGGLFLKYWNEHGGLAQQGFPISEEFVEVSALNGQAYKVQYFERAVFEFHPENQAPYNVLLSQLGTFRYRDVYLSPKTTPTVVVPPPANTPVPQPTQPPAGPCSGIPASPNVAMAPSNCEKAGTRFAFAARGFQPGENIGVYITRPDQSVNGAPFQVSADGDGISEAVLLTTSTTSQLGIWAITFEGVSSHFKAIGYFKLTPP